MKDDPALRARISALSDAELVRMLTLDADEHGVRTLLAARAEARTRGIDYENAEAPAEPTAAPEPPEDLSGLEIRGVWRPERLADWRPLVALALGSLVLEIGAAILEDQPMYLCRAGSALLAITGWILFLRGSWKLHALLREATGGVHPFTPLGVLLLNFVPLVNVCAAFWTAQAVARFGAANGRERPGDRSTPAWLYLLGLALMGLTGCGSLLLLAASQRETQRRLLHALAERPAMPASAVDWSSSAHV